MTQLKTILQSKFFYILLVITAFLYTIYSCNHITIKPKYETIINGTITDMTITENKVSFEIKGKENVLLNYYMKDKEFTFFSNLKIGDEIKAFGSYQIPSNNSVFHLFNYRNYLLSKNIKYLFQIEKSTDLIKIKNNNNVFYALKNTVREYLEHFKSKDYLKTFLIGDNTIDSIYKKSYQKNGISHLFSISGLHITIFTLLLKKFLELFIKRKQLVHFIIYFFLLFYVFLVGFTPSVMRSAFLFILVDLNKWFKLNIKTIYLLIFLFSILLFINPFYIYNIGFQFSFTISFYLIIYSKLINKFKNYFIKLFMVSMIAFLASIPICIHTFFEINLLSPFINLLFVPIVSIIIFPLSLLTLIIRPLDTILFYLVSSMESISYIISNNIHVNLILSYIDVIGILFYYLIISYVLFCIHKNKYHAIVYLILLLLFHTNINYFAHYLKITMLDVGQGDSILLKLPYNKGNTLIDTGGLTYYGKKGDYSITSSKTIPYLKSLGINKIDYLILTHGDYDHIGEAINLVENFKVEKVIFNHDGYNDLEHELIKVLDKKKIKYYKGLKELNIDKYKLVFLNTKTYNNENDNSNVIYFNYKTFKFLFMGDAGIDKEKDLLDKYNLSDIDFLKVGHHGSNTSSSEHFIDRINPKYSLISVGKNNRYGHPKESVLKNLSNSKIYRTDIDGSIEIKLNKNGYKIRTCSP